MPYSVTMARAISVARWRSFWAPVETCLKQISSAVRPPSRIASRSFSSGSVSRYRSSSGRCMVMPSAAAPRGMIETRWTGSAVGISRARSAWPISCVATISRSRSDMIRLLRSSPAVTRSMASSSSSIVTEFFSRRAARSAASLITLARSAPVNPGVREASTRRSTLGSTATPRACTCRIASRPRRSGRSTTTWRSNRPGRVSAGSRTSGRFVAAMMITPLDESNPSISTSSWFRVCSRSSCAPNPAPSAQAHEHLDELRTGHEEEGDVGLTRDRPGQQRLAAPGGPEQQYSLGDPPSQTLVLLGSLQEVHDLAELLHGLVQPGYVRKGRLHLLAVVDPHLVATQVQGRRGLGAAHPSDQEEPEQAEHQERQDPTDEEAHKAVRGHAGVRDSLLVQLLGELRRPLKDRRDVGGERDLPALLLVRSGHRGRRDL